MLGASMLYTLFYRLTKFLYIVFVIHGEEDREVNASHGRVLYEKCPGQYKYTPWFVPERGHNDVCFGKRLSF
jgi:hypothetical protein